MGLGFLDALRWLAQKVGIDPSLISKAPSNQKRAQGQVLFEAQQFFITQLQSPLGQQAKKYLHDRGFTDEHITQYGFGFAPLQGGLIRHLKSHSLEDLERCSLVSRENGKTWEFFRNRVMIPIRDFQGRLIAFGGRALDQSPQKYKNSRYDKGEVLFGFDSARKHIKSKGRAFVVEGYLDAIQMQIQGYGETVACQGTALTTKHFKQLESATNRVYLMFDGDQAGHNAALKCIENSLECPNLDVQVLSLPVGADPDSFLREDNNLKTLLKNAQDLITFGIADRLQSASHTGIPEIIQKELLPWVQAQQDPLRRDYLLKHISEATGLSRDALMQSIKRSSTTFKTARPAPQQTREEKKQPISSVTYECIGHLFFAEPGEPSTRVLKFLRQLPLTVELANAIAFCLQALKQGQTPANIDPTLWPSTILNRVEHDQAAFDTPHHWNQLEILSWFHDAHNHKQAITELTSRVHQFQQDEHQLRELSNAIRHHQTEHDKALEEIVKLRE